jgi:FAD/FMN-containing dehydrogenase
MDRRHFLKTAAAIPLVGLGSSQDPLAASPTLSRVRPGDAAWPSRASWEKLKQAVGGRLLDVKSPLAACRNAPQGAACRELFRRLENPYYVGDEPALTQSSGWPDAWTSAPSIYAVAATETADVVAAVNFAREHRLRLVVKGGGHSYQGTSDAPDSLLIWTRGMNRIVSHDAFLPQRGTGKLAPQPAVSVGAGAIWIHVYDAVTTRGGRYVQGGGCATVGVAGLIQSGGFGSYSKRFGLAAGGLLEAEVVTADGVVRIANAYTSPDLFWGLKGGGGGSLGVVTRLTLRTRDLPNFIGTTSGTVQARSPAAFRRLVARAVRFYRESLFNPHWGEQIRFTPRNTVKVQMEFQGLDQNQAREIWRPFLDWVASAPDEFQMQAPFNTAVVPAQRNWDAKFLTRYDPQNTVHDDRPNAPAGNIYWAGDRGQVGAFVHAYRSLWLPGSLLENDQQGRLVDALVASSRHWPVTLHFNKGLAGAPAEERAAALDTAMNPAVVDAFALAIIAGETKLAFPGVAGHEPDVAAARLDAGAINQAMDDLLKLVGQPASYLAESDYFERNWQQSFWGSNYPRLAAVKKKYDPQGLFFVHHGVGSEEWSADGFTTQRRG